MDTNLGGVMKLNAYVEWFIFQTPIHFIPVDAVILENTNMELSTRITQATPQWIVPYHFLQHVMP